LDIRQFTVNTNVQNQLVGKMWKGSIGLIGFNTISREAYDVLSRSNDNVYLVIRNDLTAIFQAKRAKLKVTNSYRNLDVVINC
jgi:hypothetical protein